MYIKGYEHSSFGFEPNYKCVLVLGIVVLCEMVIMLLQKCYGVKIIIPAFLRKHSYNYYYNNYNDKNDVIKTNE